MLMRTVVIVTAIVSGFCGTVSAVEAAVDCPPDLEVCRVTASTEEENSVPSGPSKTPVSLPEKIACVLPISEQEVACVDPTYGWFNQADACYYRIITERTFPAESVLWQGNHPNGAIYMLSCFDDIGTFGSRGGPAWLADPPWAAAPAPDGAALARTAVDSMRLTGPDIHTSIPEGHLGLVFAEVWLWTPVTETTWGPNSATASVPGLTVTATAQATKVVWDLGDGTSLTCHNPGTSFIKGRQGSPTCGHTFTQTSLGQPNDAFTLTATTTWDVAWSGGSQSGSFAVTRESTSSIQIGELQVLVT